jgi:prophage regulatory protein
MTTSRKTEGPSLMGAHEIRVRLGGVSRQRAHQITTRADFPKPLIRLAQGKVWDEKEVDAWLAEHGRDTEVALGGDGSD